MHIERIQVEEGFLNGLDLRPVAGLNVFIGARGTGKTSLIELIRFCFNVDGYTPETTRRSREHALSVLGSGQVTLTVADGDQHITISRSANEAVPRMSAPFVPPIIMAQTEIETVGLQPGGRLRLLDGFVGDPRSLVTMETEAVAAVRSLTIEAAAIQRDIESLNSQLAQISEIERQLFHLVPQEVALSGISADAQKRTGHLQTLSGTIAIQGVAASSVQRFHQTVARWRSTLASTQSLATLEEWPAFAGEDPLAAMRARAKKAQEHVAYALYELSLAEGEAATLATTIDSGKIGLEDQARQMRRDIESLQAGAGEIVRQGQLLRERRAQLESLAGVMTARMAAMQSATQRRSAALDTLEAIRTQRYEARAAAAAQLNMTLGPRIRIDVMRGGQTETFATVLTEALRGSGMRYMDIVGTLAQRISPRELLEAVEDDDYDLIATRGSMTIDRAAKAVIALKEADLGTIASVPVEDYVTFSLLDGADYKDIADLSTGQRCTVILPLVLRHTNRLLIVDQPEDHIDNAFIADTLIKSILARSANGQLIFSTHNANIPVLGNADLVVQLGSDGRRGYPLIAAPLGAPAVVHAITTVMEGGADAFQRRAAFYNSRRPA
jgi:hypothetical protein